MDENEARALIEALRALPPENARGSRDFGRGYMSAINDAVLVIEGQVQKQ
jgi:hypothetical protein